MARFNSRSMAAIGGGHQMLIRRAIFGGVVCLMALGSAPSLHSEEKAAESNNADVPAVPVSETPAAGEQAQGEKEAIEIPLNEIWAYGMPGTRDAGELDPNAESLKKQLERVKSLPFPEQEEQFMQLIKRSLIWQIRKSLQPGSKKAGPGFAVSAPKPELLKTVRDVLTGETKRSDSFPAGSDITAVFFARSSGSSKVIYDVERRGNVIEIRYRVVPRFELYVSQYFALIPLGTLPSGTYQVNYVLGPMDQKYLDAGLEEIASEQATRKVSQSFKFEVQR